MMFLEWNKTARYLYSRYKDLHSAAIPKTSGEKEPGIICLQPFYFVEITTNGDVYTCCPGWIRFPIGNIKNRTIPEIWNSSRARFVRRKMYCGEWQNICNRICPVVSQHIYHKKTIPYDSLEKLDYLSPGLIEEIRMKKDILASLPTVFNLSNSTQCNLSCIMCSRKDQKERPELIRKTESEIVSCLSSAKRLILTGMGDPFFRPDTRRMLLDGTGTNSDLRLDIITNGLLLPKYWDRIKRRKFGNMLISVDAAEKTVYEKIRVGGNWEALLKSLELVKDNRSSFESVTLNMTVMNSNYMQIPAFIDMAEHYGFNASFQRIRGSCGNENFFVLKDKNILDKLSLSLKNENSKSRDIQIFWEDLLEFCK